MAKKEFKSLDSHSRCRVPSFVTIVLTTGRKTNFLVSYPPFLFPSRKNPQEEKIKEEDCKSV